MISKILFINFAISFIFVNQGNAETLNATTLDPIFELRNRMMLLKDFYEKKSGEKIPVKFNIFPDIKSTKELSEKYNENQIRFGFNTFTKDINENLKKLAPFISKAEALWSRENMKNEDSYEEGDLYGQIVKTKRLGVILDVSASMEFYEEKLRKHIVTTFKKAVFYEIDGCGLYSNKEEVFWKYIDKIPTDVNPFGKYSFPEKIHFNAHRDDKAAKIRNTIDIIKVQIEFFKIDALYWFCDLKDPINTKVFKELEDLILENKVKFFVHVPAKIRPSKSKIFEDLAKKSGGFYLEKRP